MYSWSRDDMLLSLCVSVRGYNTKMSCNVHIFRVKYLPCFGAFFEKKKSVENVLKLSKGKKLRIFIMGFLQILMNEYVVFRKKKP